MIIVLTGKTASGKTTLEAELQRRGMSRAISHTTRPMRSGEVQGREYHFIDQARYDFMKFNGDFVETVEFSSACYGMSVESLNAAMTQGHVVIVAEPDGAEQLRGYCRANDIVFFNVFVECDPYIRVERWFNRMMADLGENKSSLEAYKGRLTAMLTTESRWHENFYEGAVNSSEKTPQELADEIIRKYGI